MEKLQEYLYNSSYVTIWGEVKDKPDMVIVSENDDYGQLLAVKRDQLQKKEDSWMWKQAEKRKQELDKLSKEAEKNINKVVDKVVDKACKELSMRMKLNAVFSKGTTGGETWALVIANELEKIIKEKAPDVVRGKELPF